MKYSYYDSNYGKMVTPSETGWHVAYRTESCDHDAVLVEREPIDMEDAQKMIEEIIDWEWEGGHFYAKVKGYGYHEV